MLTLESLRIVDAIARNGSFSAAAVELGKVTSALSYSVRRLEDELDVLLFDRRGRSATLTDAGRELLLQGRQLLVAADQVVNRVRRVAGGWETEIRIAVDGIVAFERLRPLIEEFLRLSPTTRLRFSYEILDGCWEAMIDDRADLAIGAAGGGALVTASDARRLQCRQIGEVAFVYCVAPHHPLATATEPIPAEVLQRHCAVAVADTVRRSPGRSAGLVDPRPAITVATLEQKVALQLSGAAAGYLPEPFARPHLAAGRLVAREVALAPLRTPVFVIWRDEDPSSAPGIGEALGEGAGRPLRPSLRLGKGIGWWLDRLALPIVQRRLLEGPVARGSAPASPDA